jgi:hypothetical protein
MVSSVVAQGIAVSPDKLNLHAGTTRTLWLTNPNDHKIDVMLESDCELSIPSRISLVRYERRAVPVEAPADSLHCTGALTVSLVDDDAQGLAVLPAVQVPVTVTASLRSYDIHSLSTSWSDEPEPSVLTGLLTSLTVVVLGLACYMFFSRFRIVRSL